MKNLYEVLKELNYKITAAESCTGGLVAASIVDFCGISDYFEESYVTYAEEAKCHILGLTLDYIHTYGVVSEEVAIEMAKGACKNSGANCGIATTGLAGPTGGTLDCPVGTVCFGFCINDQVFSKRIIFEGDRKTIRSKAAQFAIQEMEVLLNQKIEEI